MARIEKTVFLCYRRTNVYGALAIVQNLTKYGYDVFFDFSGISSGAFESIIVEQVRSRAHFLVLLTPSALKRCAEPGDWLRREIEAALDARRNIVPLMLEGFDFDTPSIAKQLTGRLAELRDYNALNVPADYFEEAMQRLRERYLNVPLDAVQHPASDSARAAARDQQAAAGAVPAVSQQELTAQQWFERGFEATDFEERLLFYSRAIRLKPDYAVVFYNRGLTRHEKGDLEGALFDYNEAIRLKPDDADYFINRGILRQEKGDLDGALLDYDQAIRLKPGDADALMNRGNARYENEDLKGALTDYDEAIRLDPDHAEAYYNRGDVRNEMGNTEGALQDYEKAIQLNPDDPAAFNNRALVREGAGELDGALSDYTEAIRLAPEYTDSFYNRAQLFEARSLYQAAIDDFQKYLDKGGAVRDGDQKEVEKMIVALRRKLRARQAVSKTEEPAPPQKKPSN